MGLPKSHCPCLKVVQQDFLASGGGGGERGGGGGGGGGSEKRDRVTPGQMFASALSAVVVRRINFMIRDVYTVCAPLSLTTVTRAQMYTSGVVDVDVLLSPSSGTYQAAFTRSVAGVGGVQTNENVSGVESGRKGVNAEGGNTGGNTGGRRTLVYGGTERVMDATVGRPERYGHQATCLAPWKVAQTEPYEGKRV